MNIMNRAYNNALNCETKEKWYFLPKPFITIQLSIIFLLSLDAKLFQRLRFELSAFNKIIQLNWDTKSSIKSTYL